MNKVLAELNKRRTVTIPSWANRAAKEIERLEKERDELLALAEELLDTELAGSACAQGIRDADQGVVGRLQIAVERIKGGAA